MRQDIMRNLLFCTAAVFIGAVILSVYANDIHTDLQNNLIRLHIIADSNSEVDQQVKLKVRDRILSEFSSRFDNTEKIEDTRRMIQDNLCDIEEIANDELRKNGFNYSAHAYYGEFEFPTKRYGNIMLPKGNYEAVRVVLGSGEGENWWCVMFPPLCFVNESKGELSEEELRRLQDSLDPDSYDIISAADKPEVIVKFKLLELLQGKK